MKLFIFLKIRPELSPITPMDAILLKLFYMYIYTAQQGLCYTVHTECHIMHHAYERTYVMSHDEGRLR